MRTFLVFLILGTVCQSCGRCNCDGTVVTENPDGSLSVTTCTPYVWESDE